MNLESQKKTIKVVAALIEVNGKIFCAQRAYGELKGKWEFPGGKNRWGESVADTLKREWMEELGVSIDVGEELASHDFVNKETLYHLSAHAVSLPEGGQFRLSVHSKLAWVTKEEMAAMPFAPSDRAIIAQLAG